MSNQRLKKSYHPGIILGVRAYLMVYIRICTPGPVLLPRTCTTVLAVGVGTIQYYTVQLEMDYNKECSTNNKSLLKDT